jgi:hypothetical protein
MMNPPADNRLRTGKLIFLGTGGLGLVLIGVLVAVDQGTPLGLLLWQLGQLLAAIALTALLYFKRARVGQGINWLLRSLERKPFAGGERPEPEDNRRWIRVGDAGYKLMDIDQMTAEIERQRQHHADELASVQAVARGERAELVSQLHSERKKGRVWRGAAQKAYGLLLKERAKNEELVARNAELEALEKAPKPSLTLEQFVEIVAWARGRPQVSIRGARDYYRSLGGSVPDYQAFAAAIRGIPPLSVAPAAGEKARQGRGAGTRTQARTGARTLERARRRR